MADSKALSRKYGPEQVDRALLAYAITQNYATAAEMVKAQGFTVPRSTLRHWVTKLHTGRYVELSNKHAAEYLETLKADYRQIVKQSGRATLEAIEKTRQDFGKLDPRDQAGAARNVATVGAIAFDKLAALESRPTAVLEHTLNADEALLKLQRILSADPTKLIEGTAEEFDGDL